MDESVKQALVKWPNVPHCYGWLALDARGAFRMRDDAAQAAQLPGDVIRHPTLLSFIYRNYDCDARGAWFFQNGPQRVYVELEATPFIARTDPMHNFVFHDGSLAGDTDQVLMTSEGRLIVQAGSRFAMLDDRDVAQCLPHLQLQTHVIDDASLLDWLTNPQQKLQMRIGQRCLPVQWIDATTLETALGFIARPSLLPI